MPDSDATTTKYTLMGVTGDQICIQLRAVNASGNSPRSTQYCLSLKDGALSTVNGQRIAIAMLRLIVGLLMRG